MDLTPGEKAVLGQIRALYTTEARREHQLKALMMQWPPIHHEAYKRAYGGLRAKQLLQDVDAQVFRLTDTGLRAIGVAIQKPPPLPAKTSRANEPKPAQPTPCSAQGKGKPAALSRLFGMLRNRESKA